MREARAPPPRPGTAAAGERVEREDLDGGVPVAPCAGAPATEAIMGSLPPERANIGSAVNDTTRALGVAIVGSIMSSLYTAQLPDAVPVAARESLGAAVTLGPAIAGAAQDAFMHAMSRASIVVAVAAVLGGVIAWR